jgi:hypothetical protein
MIATAQICLFYSYLFQFLRLPTRRKEEGFDSGGVEGLGAAFLRSSDGGRERCFSAAAYVRFIAPPRFGVDVQPPIRTGILPAK